MQFLPFALVTLPRRHSRRAAQDGGLPLGAEQLRASAAHASTAHTPHWGNTG